MQSSIDADGSTRADIWLRVLDSVERVGHDIDHRASSPLFHVSFDLDPRAVINVLKVASDEVESNDVQGSFCAGEDSWIAKGLSTGPTAVGICGMLDANDRLDA